MLVLSRFVEERVVLKAGDLRIEVVLCDIRRSRTGWKARIGFEAPAEVQILREEVEKAIEAEKARAL